MSSNPNLNRTPYPWDDLVYMWEHAHITTEQLSGQLLVHGQQLDALLMACQRELEKISHAMDDLDARVQGLEGASFQDRLAE